MSDFYLLVDSKGNATEIKGEMKIGRSKTSDLVITDPLASRHHATVYYEGDALMIRDEQSVNGVIVNRGKIYDPVKLNDRDTIQFGDEIFTVRAPMAEAATVKKMKIADDTVSQQKPGDDAQLAAQTPPVMMASEINEPPAQQAITEEKKSGNRKKIIIAGAALLVLCVCCIVTALLVNSMGFLDSSIF